MTEEDEGRVEVVSESEFLNTTALPCVTGPDVWRAVAVKCIGRPVRVVFKDPFWIRQRELPDEKPLLEVFGRVSDTNNEGFAVTALDYVDGTRQPGYDSVREGQYVYFDLVHAVELLGTASSGQRSCEGCGQ